MIEISPTSYSMTPLPTNVIIGNFSSIASDVKFHSDGTHLAELNHDCVFTTNYQQTSGPRPITIGHDVWIGDGARILDGVTIGDGSIIGAGAVISKDIRPFSVVVGNPQVVKRIRFTPEQIRGIYRSNWFHWSKEEVLERIEDMKNIDTFLKKYA